ncbi:MAG: glycosyltransferase family 2 protein [Planctomycetia bacterium]|nr:glycosyltransferase family 2 protein [Planctomycetia bacterium]
MRYLTVCAIVKDEDPFLEEWLRYHELLGVEYFHLYDNGSRVPLVESLARFIEEGLVGVERVEGQSRQCEVFRQYCEAHADDCRWAAMIDVDEFVVPHRVDSLPDLLRPYEGYGGLAVNWQVFGTSGHQARPPGLQVANFTKKLPATLQPNEHVKTVCRPERVASWRTSHCPTCKPGSWVVNEDGDRVDGPFSPVRVATVQVNHYYTRSRDDWALKLVRGNHSPPGGAKRKPEVIDWIDRESVVDDASIARFIPRLGARLAGGGH